MAPDLERRLWHGHSIVGRSGATGCGVPGVWGDEALATQGEAGQEHGVGGGLLAADGAHHRRPGGLGGDRDRAAGADGDPALAGAAGRPRSGADDDRSRPYAPQARGVRPHRRERGTAHPGRLRGLRAVLRPAGLISRFVKSFEVGQGVAEVTTERSTTERWPIAAGTGLGPVHLSVTDGGQALRFGEDRQWCRHTASPDKAITLTLLRNAAG